VRLIGLIAHHLSLLWLSRCEMSFRHVWGGETGANPNLVTFGPVAHEGAGVFFDV
jgi:hypothetical protein